ncbi:unnamed protein product [Euphydryas editha]|uniref:Ionotropic receptor n=1 Tax=Euphydryas editha TaxID=104508 RepID=A0AAU9UDD9_EUPED|nr:unnamed protein product [Euphydryas editha]
MFIVINSELITDSDNVEEQNIDIIAEIVLRNLKNNGWNNILFMGRLPDLLYHRLKKLPFTFTVTDVDTYYEPQPENLVPYHSNVIIMNCADMKEFENALKKIVTFPYWHPLSNIILYYHAPYSKEVTAKIFFSYWYYRAINVVIVQYDETEKSMIISYYSPYMTENYKFENIFGCWTAKKIGMQIENFEKSFVCEMQCHNVTSYTKIRASHLGTCIGFVTVSLKNAKKVQYLNLLEDKGKNLHGFTFYAYSVEVIPFFRIVEHKNKTYTFYQRDAAIWNTMAKLLNFTIDITPAVNTLKQKFNFELYISQVFSFSQRKVDLILYPLYQFDLILAEVDYTVPYIDSGVCILSHRAGFQTIIFDVNLVEKNISIIIEFLICLICIWFVFFIYNTEQIGKVSLDQAGKDFINTIKSVLSISLYKPPKRGSFRIFLGITMWCFFILSFSVQAAIISLFSVYKKDKEVDTFEDIIRKGYDIEGIASPDVVLPDTEEKYRIISSKIKTVKDLFGCVKKMENDSRRFCLIDCAIGRYLERNMLNKKGTQFLHLASYARIHSHYLNMIFHKNSPLTENYNKYIMKLFEAGLIKKWMEYRYFDFKEEATVKSLGMNDLGGIFECYGYLLVISFIVFLFEKILGLIFWVKHKFYKNDRKIKNISLKSVLKIKLPKVTFGKSNEVNTSTQTV